VHGSSTLLYVHELLAFLSHDASWNVVGAKSAAELGPWHLVVCGASGSVVGVATQLLCGEEGLLHLHAVQEPKLGLDHPKPVIGLERLSCLGEERWVSGHKVIVGSRCWSGSIPCPMAAMSRVGHQLSQQLGLLIPGLKDQSNRLSQGPRQRRVPVWVSGLGITPSIVIVHHSVIQTSHH
jgi:hypothetical protein